MAKATTSASTAKSSKSTSTTTKTTSKTSPKLTKKQPKSSIVNQKAVADQKVSQSPEVAKPKKLKVEKDLLVSSEILKAVIAGVVTFLFVGSLGLGLYIYQQQRVVNRDLVAQISKLESQVATLSQQVTVQQANQDDLEKTLQPVLVQLKPKEQPKNLAVQKPSVEGDIWYGNQDAKIVLIVHSDLECPFCNKFHPELKKVVDSNPDVAWVFRHYPLTNVHPKALKYSEGVECARVSGSSEKALSLVDKIFANQSSMSEEKLYQLGEEVGQDIRSCVNNGLVKKDFDNKVSTNTALMAKYGFGTPTTVIYNMSSGQNIVVSGAISAASLQSEIDKVR